MRIITAFDSFKGCMTAKEACQSAAEGIRQAYPDAEVVCLPLSDGGEGMVDCISEALGLESIALNVTGPLKDSVVAHYSIAEINTCSGTQKGQRTAFMEMAAASGLTHVPVERRNPMETTTYGVGEMILDAIRRGCQKIVMGIGGSATCDGGKGMIECLRPYLPLSVQIVVASDVSNPLYGPEGAAYVFAPQKGATPEQVRLLDERLHSFARETEALGYATPELADSPGAGAAGGLGYGLLAYLNAMLTSGIDLLLDTIQFDEKVRNADYVLTGEGKSDQQTLYMGKKIDKYNDDYAEPNVVRTPKKVPAGVLARTMQTTTHSAQVLLLSGSIEDSERLLSSGFTEVHSINEGDPRPLEILMQRDIAMNNMTKFCSTKLQLR